MHFHAHPSYQGKPWHDWAFVKYTEKDKDDKDAFVHYSSLILGFIHIPGEEDASAVARTYTNAVS